jgi:hypothetical protein
MKTFFAFCFLLLSTAQAVKPTSAYVGEVSLQMTVEMDKYFTTDLTADLQRLIITTESITLSEDPNYPLPYWASISKTNFSGNPGEDEIGTDYYGIVATTDVSKESYLVEIKVDVKNSSIPDVYNFFLSKGYRSGIGSSTSKTVNDFAYAFYLPDYSDATGKHKTSKTLPSTIKLHEDGFLYGSLTKSELLKFRKVVIPIETPKKKFYAVIDANSGYGN